MPIEAIATKQNPRSTTAGLQRSILRIVVCWSRRPNKVMAVNRIGTSSNKITCRPFTSIAVALDRITSPPGAPGSAGVTDPPWYTGPNAKKTPAAQAKAWATHADTVATPIDLRCPSVPSATEFRAPGSQSDVFEALHMWLNCLVVDPILQQPEVESEIIVQYDPE